MFETSEDVTLNEPTVHSNADSVASLTVVRGKGMWGVVNVPYRVTMVGSPENVTDLEPAQGYITFQDRQVGQSLEPDHLIVKY